MDNPFSPQRQRDTRGNPGTRPEAGAAWCRCPHSRAVFEQIFSHIAFVVAAVVLLLLTAHQGAAAVSFVTQLRCRSFLAAVASTPSANSPV